MSTSAKTAAWKIWFFSKIEYLLIYSIPPNTSCLILRKKPPKLLYILDNIPYSVNVLTAVEAKV